MKTLVAVGALMVASCGYRASYYEGTTCSTGVCPGELECCGGICRLPDVTGTCPGMPDDGGTDTTSLGDASSANQILLAGGNNQGATGGAPLSAPLAVYVRDASGNRVSGVTVTFVVTAGSGTVSAPSVATDAQGLAQASWTVGAPGPNTVEARASGLVNSPIVFTAHVMTSLSTKVDFTAGANPRSVAIGDFNGNGKPDLAVMNRDSNTISVFLNTTTTGATTPTLATKVDFTTGTAPLAIAVGDINGDGKPDLAAANYTSNTVSVLLNTTATGSTTPTFATKVDFAARTGPGSVAIGDLNGDGKPDLAVTGSNANTVSVLLNTTTTGATTPSFATKVDFPTGAGPYSVTIGDVNGDGRPDLSIANYNAYAVSVLPNTTTTGSTTPTFATKVDFPTGTDPARITIGDLNGDGKLDLAVQGIFLVSVLLNSTASGASTPSFTAKVEFAAGSSPQSVAIGDLNGDGKRDLAVANFSSSTVSVLLNTMATGAPTATFATKVDFPTGSGAHSVATSDLNGDGKPDLVVANANSNTISVLLAQ